jgi:hypothetical protein
MQYRFKALELIKKILWSVIHFMGKYFYFWKRKKKFKVLFVTHRRDKRANMRHIEDTVKDSMVKHLKKYQL